MDTVKSMIKETAQDLLPLSTKQNRTHKVVNVDLKRLSDEQKLLRMKSEQATTKEMSVKFKQERKIVLKQIDKIISEAEEERLDKIIDQIDSVNDDSKMFKAVKLLHTKNQKANIFVHDKNGKSVTKIRKVHNIINNHFENFSKPDIASIDQHKEEPKPLDNELSSAEIKKAVSKMSNNKAPGKDNIPVELIKYSPDIIFEIFADNLNKIFSEHKNIQVGEGIIRALNKPGKPKGPVKNLRPVTLLDTCRKILSKVFITRTQDDVNSYLSQSQSAYRKGRSTSDVVWAHRWVLAKVQEHRDLIIFVIGIAMSSAFDTNSNSNSKFKFKFK